MKTYKAKVDEFVAKELVTDEGKGEIKTVVTRFGEVNINLDKKVFFYYGLLGIPGSMNFCISDFPGLDQSAFKILQSVEDDNLTFLTLPLVPDENGVYPFIDKEDIDVCQKELDVSDNDLVVVLIATLSNLDGKSQIFVNVRAPLIIDAGKFAGVQYVFHNNKYQVRQPLPSI